MSAQHFHPLRVSRLDRLTPDAVAITFEVPPPVRELFRFAAGQHVTVRCTIAGDDVRRTYSIASPAPDGPLRIGVRRLPGGVFSGYACQRLDVGDTIEVMPPSGRFAPPADPTAARHHAAIAGGSGITPVLSVVATTLDREPASRCTVILANRTAAGIMFLDELENLRDRHLGRLDLIHVLDGETHDVELLSGRLDGPRLHRVLDRLLPPDGVDEWYLSGPPGLIDTAVDVLRGRGVSTRHLHHERFIPATPPPRDDATPHDHAGPPRADGPDVAGDGSPHSAVVRLDGRTTALDVPDGATVLDAVLQARPDAPYACRGGVCGTCRARLLEGRVRMERTFALEQEELADGYVLTCQARPTSPVIRLDYDS